jgi:membrane-associated phospholipid phosphatase
MPRLLGVITLGAILLAAPGPAPAADDAATAPVGESVPGVDLSALKVNWVVDGVVTGVSLAVWVLPEFLKDWLVPPTPRWYEPPGVDVAVRTALVWPDPKPAALTSDVLVAAIPLGLGLWVFLEGAAAGNARTVAEDLLVITEAMAVAGALTSITRYSTVRIRPFAYYGEGTGIPEDRLSFWSGHTTTAFSAAAAAGYVAQLRGYPSWPWIYAVGFTAAGAVSYFRVAGDKHWMTDVVVGAVVGTGIGFLVPWLHRANPELGLRLVPQSQGLAVSGRF